MVGYLQPADCIESPKIPSAVLFQVSQYGACLDVAVDNFSRGAIVACSVEGPWPALLITLEALTFACTNAVRSPGTCPELREAQRRPRLH